MAGKSDPAGGADGSGGANNEMLQEAERIMKESQEFYAAYMNMKGTYDPPKFALKTTAQSGT